LSRSVPAALGLARFRESIFVAASLAGTLAALALLVAYVGWNASVSPVSRAVYLATALGLFYCAIAYQLSRFGAARRRPFAEAAETELPATLSSDVPGVTVLIPSYREEQRVLRMTILSAALASYGNRRIVVLVDDPPHSDSVGASRAVIDDVRDMLAQPAKQLASEQSAFEARLAAGQFDARVERQRLKQLYLSLATWLGQLSRYLAHEITAEFAHVDRFFIDRVVDALAARYRRRAADIARPDLTPEAAAALYAELSLAICADIAGFERKRFANFSHAPNKAMNLNSYIGLIGGHFVEKERNGRLVLAPVAAGETPTLSVPTTPYVLTLDADSVILPDYISTLAREAEADPTIGVVQTPYHTFPDSPHPVERVAGATTDIQYLVHQGSSYYGAAFWVGANALLRLDALADIRRSGFDGDKPVDIFIQDATVIEDTGSTVDLLQHGWRVHNHFAPLAYSATPADFGSLAIQRQRWSNGGLLILPALLRDFFANRGRFRRLPELFVRSHYLLSPLIGNAAILVLMLMSVTDARHMVWTPLAMVPYFWLYAEDLRARGYRRRDVFGVSALNLLLLPVGLAGVCASVIQAITGRKSAFWRTPKIAGRTTVAPVFLVFNLLLMATMARYAIEGALSGDWLGILLPATNLALYGYGMHRFIGWRNCAADLVLGVAVLLRRLLSLLLAALRPALRPLPRIAAVAIALLVGMTPVNNGTASSTKAAAQVLTPADLGLPEPAFTPTVSPDYRGALESGGGSG
jgi:cellulose synthase (UDP-forming)